MANDKQLKQDFVIEVLNTWGPEMLRVLRSKIKAKKLELSKELLNSLEIQVMKEGSDGVASLLLAFEEYGRIKDMRGVNYKKMMPVSVAEDFVRAIGLENFKYVPGYKHISDVPANRAISRIAWGIAKNRSFVNKVKPKKWFSRPFYSTINVLIDKLLREYQEYAIQHTKTELKKAFK